MSEQVRKVNAGPGDKSNSGDWQPIPANWCRMTLRERWRRQMHYQRVDRIPNFEFGYWDETLKEWHKQGLPESVNNERRAYAYFGIENWRTAGPNVGLQPAFETRVLEETDEYIIVCDSERATYKQWKGRTRTIPHYIRYGIQNRADWELFRERLNPETPRYPADWEQRVEEYRRRDYPLAIGIGSLIGKPRNWVGFENIAIMAYDDPALLEEIIETVTNCIEHSIVRALKDVEFDFAAGWEDICFRSGPLLSPAMFDRWLVPRYRRITDLLHKHGVHIAWTDCDGNVVPIVPQFLRGGINCMFPVEVAAGSDPIAMRHQFGEELLLHGGVNKRALSKGFKEIRAEIERLLPLVRQGGYVPHIDHRCPADVPLRNYKYYLKLKREIFGAGDLLPHYDERDPARF